MKTLRFPYLIKLSCLLLGLAFFNSCKNPAEDVSIQVNTDIFKSPTVIQFENANENASTPNNVSISFSGPGASLVRTVTGGTNFNVSNGFINIVLDRNANPTTGSPVKVTATINAPGYAPTYLDLTFTDPKAKQFKTVKMFQYSRPAEGTAAVVKTQSLTGGQTSAPVTISTTPNATQPQSTSLAIPASTSFKDAAGNVVNAAQLETRVIYTAVKSDGSINQDVINKPIVNPVNENGQPITGALNIMPIASASINMYAGNTEIKSFTNPINLDMELPADFINPITNAALKVGDTFDAWSVNEETGQWKKEGTASVVINSAGKLVARKAITHLTSWELVVPAITYTGNITITRNDAQYEEFFNVNRETVSLKEGESSKTIPTSVTVYPIANITSRNVLVYSIDVNSYTEAFKSLRINSNNFNLTANFTKKNSAIPAELNLKFSCTNKNLTTSPNLALKFENLTTKSSSIVSVDNGKASGSVYNGESYRVFIEIDGVTYSTTFSVNNGTAEITGVQNLSASVTKVGAGFKVDATISKPCN